MLPAETSIRCEEETGPHAYLMVPPQSGRDGSDGIASADIKSGTIAVRSLHGHIARNLVINDPHVLIPNPPIEA